MDDDSVLGLGVFAANTGICPPAVAIRRPVRPFHDMIVGDDVAVAIPYEAGTGATRNTMAT